MEQIEQVVETVDLKARSALEIPGYERQSTAELLALHLTLLDTHSSLYSVGDREPSPVDPETIVILGRENSRPLYEARMACRQAGIELPGLKPHTGQFFIGNPYQSSVTSTNLYNGD